MRLLIPAEKAIYEHWLKEIVKPKKIKLKITKPPRGFKGW